MSTASCKDKELLLIKACKEGNTELARNLLQQGVDPTQEDAKHYNAIQRACSFNSYDIVEFMLLEDERKMGKEGGLANWSSTRGWFPAHAASTYGRVEIVRLLISHGATNNPGKIKGEDEGRDRDGVLLTPKDTAATTLKQLSSSGKVLEGASTNKADYKQIIKMWDNPRQVLAEYKRKKSASQSVGVVASRTSLVAWSTPSPSSDTDAAAAGSANAPVFANIMADQQAERQQDAAGPAFADARPTTPVDDDAKIIAAISLEVEKTEFIPKQQKPEAKLDELKDKLPQGLSVTEVVELSWRAVKIINQQHHLVQLDLLRCLLMREDFSIGQCKSDDGTTPLHYAAKYSDGCDIVYLLVNHPKTSYMLFVKDDNHGNTPLHIAAARGCVNTIGVLMNAKADPLLENGNGCTVLQEAAAKDASGKAVCKLLKLRPNLVNKRSMKGFTALHSAARYGKLEVTKLLLHYGANPLTRSTYRGYSAKENAEIALENMRTTSKSSTDLIKVIQRLDEEERKATGEYIKTLHANKSFMEIERSFLDAATYGDIRYLNEIYAIYPEILRNRTGFLALQTAAYYGQVNFLKELKKKYKAENIPLPINEADDEGQTALHLAVVFAHCDAVQWLLQEGADPRKRNQQGFSAVHEAAAKGHDDIVSLLLNQDEQFKLVNANLVSSTGYSVLCSAARYGHLKVVETLIKSGAALQFTGPYGDTILDITLSGAARDVHYRGQHLAVVQLLLDTDMRYHSASVSKIFNRQNIIELLAKYKNQEVEYDSVLFAADDDVEGSQDEIKHSPLRMRLLQVDVTCHDFPGVDKCKVSPKPGGSNPGAIYAYGNWKWLGKMGYEVLGRSDPRAQGIASTRSRAEVGIKLDAAKEKVGMDFYAVLAETAGPASYEVPLTCLAYLPIRNPAILDNSEYCDKINRTFPTGSETSESLFVMSQWCDDFQTLGDAKTQPVVELLKAGSFPESFELNLLGQQQPIIMSTDGLIRLLAHARILGDVDVFGVGLGNIGIRYGAAGAKWCKVDGTHTFCGYSRDDYVNHEAYLQEGGDRKDIQCNSWGAGEVCVIKWKKLSPRQQALYIESLARGIDFCQDEQILNFILYREEVFQQYGFMDTQIAMTYKGWRDWIKGQGVIYQDELREYRDRSGEQLSAWFQERKQALGLIVVRPVVSLPGDLPASASGSSGNTTRAVEGLLNLFQQHWKKSSSDGLRSWPPNEEIILNMIASYTNGDAALARGSIGKMISDNGSVLLRKKLMEKGVTSEQLEEVSDGSINAIMKKFGYKLSRDLYEELPLFLLMQALQCLMRHNPRRLEQAVAAYRAKNPVAAPSGDFGNTAGPAAAAAAAAEDEGVAAMRSQIKLMRKCGDLEIQLSKVEREHVELSWQLVEIERKISGLDEDKMSSDQLRMFMEPLSQRVSLAQQLGDKEHERNVLKKQLSENKCQLAALEKTPHTSESKSNVLPAQSVAVVTRGRPHQRVSFFNGGSSNVARAAAANESPPLTAAAAAADSAWYTSPQQLRKQS